MNVLPRFAIVGHPNKGKSSIVAALTQQGQVAISELSGTTTQSQAFEFRIQGDALYSLTDTPGFQRPRQMLEWLQQQTPNAAERLAAIEHFIATFTLVATQSGRFKDEIELLKPILAGANIIYVVDGSVPYSPEYEAEMTILQWTGQPRMALINPINGDHYIDDWRNALGQFFSVVQVFNPMQTAMQEQLRILQAFALLNPLWQPALQAASKAIKNQNQQQKQQAGALIARYLATILAYQHSIPLIDKSLKSVTQNSLSQHYSAYLTNQEQQLQQDLHSLYAHNNLDAYNTPIDTNYPDLLDQSYWYLFGLSRTKLIALSASAGAAAGALLDLGVGGASLMAGSLLGGISSAAATTWLTENPEKVRIKNLPIGGKQLQIGPVTHLQFAFVLLGRALNYQHALATHSHANRNALHVNDNTEHWLNGLNKTQQLKLTQILQKAHKRLTDADISQCQMLVTQLISDASDNINANTHNRPHGNNPKEQDH
ncbi:DUF3482 domain-containing protein [Marinagarivorans algicola]|uniref:DUF3482 domain-containing protein n=1 Tax=Marinagarivorans algicola TaxID=1513270 RepID=UPI0006B929DD|nr:DUF3482 domain-containing protein [Marinagarivorans algicola]